MSAPTIATRRPTPGRQLLRPSGRLGNAGIMGITAVVIIGVAWLANQPAPAPAGYTPVQVSGIAGGTAPVVRAPAPDFQATTDEGTALRLADLAGSPVWLTFGASWCQPCRAENPDIQAAWEAWQGRGLRVVQVYMTEDVTAVQSYAQTVRLTYTRVPDPDTRLAAAYRIVGIPTHFFIGRDGVLRQLKIGTLDPGTMESALTEIAG
jgi:peroxiredoxin